MKQPRHLLEEALLGVPAARVCARERLRPTGLPPERGVLAGHFQRDERAVLNEWADAFAIRLRWRFAMGMLLDAFLKGLQVLLATSDPLLGTAASDALLPEEIALHRQVLISCSATRTLPSTETSVASVLSILALWA